MQNIVVGRYETGSDKGHEWAGWIEPEDLSWIMFVGDDPSNVAVFLNRDPETGAVL